ncbi:hypothetical protein LTR87_017760 [Friedmanniomyces endolithicus]|nr:hypothetical protein LTR87_017760 [Friedmanniomyces endolithicus]
MPLLTGRQAQQNLIEEFNLSTAKDEKPIMRAEDEFELLKTLWESPEVGLQHERLQVQLALMIQLAGITGNRPGALRRLQYKDLKIALLPDRAGGDWPRLVMDFTFQHTKRYLSAKDPNTFPVPDIPWEPRLLLCPQTMLLSLLFADDAFAVPGLKLADLLNLRIPPSKRELLIPIKLSKAELPLFQRTEHTTNSVKMLCKAVTENWLCERLQLLGQITGFDLPVKPYCFRWGHSEALDSSSVYIINNYISDSQRNLILQHSSLAVFQLNYLSQYITQDTQAAYRGLEPQTAIIRAASGMSRSIDPQRPRSLTDRQVATVDRHLEVVLAQRVRDRLAERARARHTTITRSKGTTAHETYQQAQRAYLRTKREVRKAMMKQVRIRYRVEQPVADILHQLKGRSTQQSEPTNKGEAEKTLSSERQRVLAALLTFAPSELTDDHGQRAEAMNAVTALCKRQESPVRKACRMKEGCSDHTPEAHLHATICAEDEKIEYDSFPVQCQPTQCIFCIGDEELSPAKRAKSFRNRDGLKRHFIRKHLQYHAARQRIKCPHPKCHNEWLEHADHLRNHAATVHGSLT